LFTKNISVKEGNIMDILNLISPILENIGFPALIFLIWYVYHNSQVKAINKIIKNNFEILKQMLETNQNNTGILSRIENKIDNNLWCPILKREIGQIGQMGRMEQ